MSISPDFLQVCDEYRPVTKAFATTVDKRLNQSYLVDTPVISSSPGESLEAVGTLKAKMNVSMESDRDRVLNNFTIHKERFICFLKHLNKHINSTYVLDFDQFKCDTPEMCNSIDYDENEYVLYHAYIVLACRCYLIYKHLKPEWKPLREFVQNIATRIYRLPRTARYIHAATELFQDYPISKSQIDKEEYKELLNAIKTACP